VINRALTTLLAAVLVLVLAATPGTAGAGDAAMSSAARAVTGTDVDDGSDPDADTTRPTVNEFFPEQRPLGDCLSSLPKPDCGSEARGGWAQTAVLLAIVAGLAFIAWRVVAGSRRARRERVASVTPGTRDATTVPDGDGDGPAP
jgi:hypothetical protein